MENLSPLLQATINNSNSGAKVENTSINTNTVQQPAPRNNLTQDKFTPNTRFTQKGNHYEKTNIGKIIGVIGGAVYGAYKSLGIKELMNEINFKTIMENIIYSFEEGIDPAKAEKMIKYAVKATPKYVTAALILGSTLIGLGVGSIVNFVINKIKAHKADKEGKAQ